MKTDLFQSCGHCWIFQIFWHIECSILTASSFRIWSSSAGIPSPALALLVVAFLKGHLTSHSRMSGSRGMTTLLWLAGSLRPFLYNSSVYFCHLFSISSASLRPLPFLSFIVPIFAGNVPFLVQPLSHVWLFVTPWTAAPQASLSFTISQSSLKLMSIELVMFANYLIPCHPLFLLPSIFPSMRVFSNKLTFYIRWPKYWSLSISPSNENSRLVCFRTDWFYLLAVYQILRVFSNSTVWKHQLSSTQPLWSNSHIHTWLLVKP